MRYLVTVLAVVFVISMIFIVKNMLDRHTYSSYQVIQQQKKSDSVSKYEYLDGRLLRYSIDGAALLKSDLTVIWDEAYSMVNPKVAISGDQVLVYDCQGTACHIYSGDKKEGSFETTLPILKADVSKKGTVALILMDGTKSKFLYCRSDGTQIATGAATITDPGYPTDVAVSANGENVAISYLNVKDRQTGSTVEFYNFGRSGVAKENHMTASEHFSSFVPELYYLDQSRCVLVRDDGVSIYRGSGEPKEEKQIQFRRDIVSAFRDNDHMVFLFGTTSGKYKMEIYTADGSPVSSETVSLQYQNARISDDQIIFYQGNAFSIYSMKGFCRFRGELQEGKISDIIKIARNRYLVLTDEGMEMIRLK